MIRINLLSPENIKKEERREILYIGYAVFCVVFVVASFIYLLNVRSYGKLNDRLQRSQGELNKYETIVKQVDALEATKNILQTKKNVIRSLMMVRLIYPRFMEKLLDVTPGNVWFKNIATTLRPDGGMTVTLDAESLDNYAIADFVGALMHTQDFESAELGPIIAVQADKLPSSAFRVNFVYKKKS